MCVKRERGCSPQPILLLTLSIFNSTQDSWRTVTVDDRIPVDLFGQPLLVGVRPLQLWPLLLSKAVLKVRSLTHMHDACNL